MKVTNLKTLLESKPIVGVAKAGEEPLKPIPSILVRADRLHFENQTYDKSGYGTLKVNEDVQKARRKFEFLFAKNQYASIRERDFARDRYRAYRLRRTLDRLYEEALNERDAQKMLRNKRELAREAAEVAAENRRAMEATLRDLAQADKIIRDLTSKLRKSEALRKLSEFKLDERRKEAKNEIKEMAKDHEQRLKEGQKLDLEHALEQRQLLLATARKDAEFKENLRELSRTVRAESLWRQEQATMESYELRALHRKTLALLERVERKKGMRDEDADKMESAIKLVIADRAQRFAEEGRIAALELYRGHFVQQHQNVVILAPPKVARHRRELRVIPASTHKATPTKPRPSLTNPLSENYVVQRRPHLLAQKELPKRLMSHGVFRSLSEMQGERNDGQEIAEGKAENHQDEPVPFKDSA